MPAMMQTPQSILSTFMPFGPPVLSTHGFPKKVLLASAQPLAKAFIDIAPYPESAAQWLISLLNLLIDIANRNEDFNRVMITEAEYQQLSAVLDDLIYGVGDDENHPLSAAMTLVGGLMKTYEDQHSQKLVDIYPELAKEVSAKIIDPNKSISAPLSAQIETDFFFAFLSIACLLWKGGKMKKAIAAYDLANRIYPDDISVYAGRGEAKSSLKDLMGAKADLQRASELAEKQKEKKFSIAIEGRLLELDAVESVIEYFAEPKFAKFSTLRECKIQIGRIHSRADIVLHDAEGNFVAIAECKSLVETNYGTEQLKSYLCATDTPFGILASGTNRDSWVFHENLRHNRFRQIKQSDFEKRILEQANMNAKLVTFYPTFPQIGFPKHKT